MNPLGLRSRFSHPNTPLQASPLRFENNQTSPDFQPQHPERRSSEASILSAMNPSFNFAPPAQLSPSSLNSQQHHSPSSISLPASQFTSPTDNGAPSFTFNFSQSSSHQSSPSEAFSSRNFHQQPQIQQYQQQFLHHQFQQQQQQQRHPHNAFKQPVTRSFSQPHLFASTRQHPLQQEHRPAQLALHTPPPGPGILPSQPSEHAHLPPTIQDDEFSLTECLQEPSSKRQRQSLDEVFQTQPPTQSQGHTTNISSEKEPQESGEGEVGGIPSRRPYDPWMLRGSCACCHVQYELSASPHELPLQACYCHCAVCRNLSGSNYIAFTSVPTSRLRWYSGQWDWKSGRGKDITAEVLECRAGFTFGKAPGFATAAASVHFWSSSRKAVRASCAKCGSVLFISYHSGGAATTDIALGTLWDADERGHNLVKPVMHIMLREKAIWEEVPDDGLLRYDGMPGEGPRKASDDDPGGKDASMGNNSQDTLATNLKHLLKCMLVY